MKERGIIFRDWEVRAILDGRKTMFRSVSKSEPRACRIDFKGGPYKLLGPESPHGNWPDDLRDWWIKTHCPFGTVGDRLYVKETWAHDAPSLEECRAAREDLISGMNCGPYYRATEIAPETLKWRSPAAMPRWASRLKLEIVNVRVERVQEISENDVTAEGIREIKNHNWRRWAVYGLEHLNQVTDTAAWSYSRMWDSIHGPGAWERNDWVWAVTFKRLEGGAA